MTDEQHRDCRLNLSIWLSRVEKDDMLQKSLFLDQKWIVMANRWKESNPKHSVWPISDRVSFLLFILAKLEYPWCQQNVLELWILSAGSKLQPSPYQDLMDNIAQQQILTWEKLIKKSNITEKPKNTIIPKSRESIFAFQLCDRLGFALGRPGSCLRLLKSTDGKENELWIGLCPVVNLSKSKDGKRTLFLCLTTVWQHRKWKWERPRAPQRIANRGMGQIDRNQKYQQTFGVWRTQSHVYEKPFVI